MVVPSQSAAVTPASGSNTSPTSTSCGNTVTTGGAVQVTVTVV